eukprot:m.15959 g.15959  ORF g.15959 m.15959 type:complete len:116 (-) comp7924_c0_seq2:230-577(-)
MNEKERRGGSGAKDGKRMSEVSIALVREFLARHGLKSTLATLDAESPRTRTSITKRSDIAKSLRVEKWMKRNKESETPLNYFGCDLQRIARTEIAKKWIRKCKEKSPQSQPWSST